VRETVEAGGAQKDIFPSLHTAAPTFFAIFSFRHRKLVPFKYSWPVVAFLATQIIIATMFLRWHYLVDIVAGLALATTAALLGPYVADWERAKRERLGLQPAWTPLVYPWSRPTDE
jgi:membrane-associated phospholipid phosphatase